VQSFSTVDLLRHDNVAARARELRAEKGRISRLETALHSVRIGRGIAEKGEASEERGAGIVTGADEVWWW